MSEQSLVILREARKIQSWIVDLRRRIHRHPELMYEEFETSRLVQETLAQLGIPFTAGLAETGVVATLGTGSAPCVGLRADMDALPIDEQADVTFRSEIAGKMHACGHDCHTAMLLGAARLLKQHEDQLPGTVRLIFQPAEEGGAGGQRMLAEGALAHPDVQRMFGLHVWSESRSGTIASRVGTFLAAAGEVDIVVRGRGGHAAMPHLTIDPVTTAAKIVCELQTLVARELNPLSSGVVSITQMRAGDAYNVIPPEVCLGGTIRALTLEELQWLQNRVREQAEGIGAANGCTVEVSFPGIAYPPTVNDGDCWDLAKEIGAEMLGNEAVHQVDPVMGGEDFSFYTQQVPGCFVGLGIRNEDCGSIYSVHHPRFKVDEDALPLGTALHVAFARRSLADLQG